MRKYRTAGIGCASLLVAAGGLAATGMPAAAQGAPAPAAAPGGSCDTGLWDWDDARIDGEKYNPVSHGTKVQLWQAHVMWEDTYAVATAGRSGSRIYIEDRKSKQKCWSEAAEYQGQEIETGVLDNRNTSVRACIVTPGSGGKPFCGGWYREDAGGHRQLDDGRGKIDGYPDYDRGSKASYDYHREPSKFSKRIHPDYDAKYGPDTLGLIARNLYGDADNSFAHVRTNNKDMLVSLQSDKYGQGEWSTVRRAGSGTYSGSSGILYNEHDALRVCLKQPGDTSPTCGKWHRG